MTADGKVKVTFPKLLGSSMLADVAEGQGPPAPTSLISSTKLAECPVAITTVTAPGVADAAWPPALV